MQTTPASGFVIALCTMDRAIPIPQPRSAPLNRYRFFLTRRRANGRELFVLHMGTFETAAEADKWLNVLRGTYPNAYVSDSADLGPTPSLSDSQVLRVLEVRPPTMKEEEPPPAARPQPALTLVKTPERPPSPLDASLQDLAERESETGMYEALTDTGVRHLKIEVSRKPSRRPRNRLR